MTADDQDQSSRRTVSLGEQHLLSRFEILVWNGRLKLQRLRIDNAPHSWT